MSMPSERSRFPKTYVLALLLIFSLAAFAGVSWPRHDAAKSGGEIRSEVLPAISLVFRDEPEAAVWPSQARILSLLYHLPFHPAGSQSAEFPQGEVEGDRT